MVAPEVTETVAPVDDGLGPSMTAEFQGALPLEDLVKAKPARKASAPAPVQQAALDSKIFANMITQVDSTLSNLLNFQAEADEDLQPVIDGMYPLAAYYTTQEASVTTLWIVAGLSLLSYSSLKLSQRRAEDGNQTEAGEEPAQE